MNCKPGDLAIVVATANAQQREYIGKIVTCVKVVNTIDGPVGWRTAPFLVNQFTKNSIAWVDHHLRPIRDPGDDATDETLQWLPTPSREKEAA